MNNDVRVRFAPSPTGYLHVGGLRTALYNYLFARRNNGTFILRIEDTDRKRYVQGAVENLFNTLKAVNLTFDEGPLFQSERNALYHKYCDSLIAKDSAYKCFCSPEDLEKMRDEQRDENKDVRYDGRCRELSQQEIKELEQSGKPYVVRAKTYNEGTVEFDDIIRGQISFRWDMIEDQVLMKSDGFPTYHLANVVDDHEMGITHIIRGEEWLTSTPKHIFLYRSLGWETPVYAHLPLLLNPDKSKLSKRQGDVAVEDFLNKGYLPEALINYVALLGWHPAEDKEIFSLRELENEFSLERINKAGAVFDIEKLKWMNGLYIRTLDDNDLAGRTAKYFAEADIDIKDRQKLFDAVSYAKERINLLPEIIPETEMFFKEISVSKEEYPILAEESSQNIFRLWVDRLAGKETISEDDISALLAETTQELGVKGKKLYFPLRIALYGKEHGPNIPVIIKLLGKEEAIRRLNEQIT